MFAEVPALHLILAAAAGDVPGATTTGGDHTVLIALLGVVAAIGTAVVTGMFGTRGERAPKRVPQDVRKHVANLQWDAAHAENDLRDAEARSAAQVARIDVLEHALIYRGFAPWRITTGEEPDDEIRLPAGHRPRPHR